jgi:hypothetical protein
VTWDEWRGSNDGRPSMLIKRIFDRWGYRVDLHKFIRADDPDCKHTHPATAIRIVLWGGYEEELREGSLRVLRPGTVGIVKPELCHRIHRLLNERCSYSLWFRGRKRAPVEIVGTC